MNKTLAYLTLGIGYLASQADAQTCRDDWRLDRQDKLSVSVRNDVNERGASSSSDGFFALSTGIIFYLMRKPFKDRIVRNKL